MRNISYLLYLVAVLPVLSIYQEPIRQTCNGPVKGAVRHSRLGREYLSFRGIPFAQPPVGELRFKEPQPPLNWTGTWDATKEGPYCIQKNYFFADPKVEGQEDCLYLNVYVPKVATKELLPVMVFIHWGGFFAGRGTSDYIGPEYLMDKNIILVTFNYRLGVLGFLSTLDDEAPGNYGLKDQVAALQWVNKNIQYFGGNKKQVTLFGQSAGGGSVHLHIITPSSEGLFQRAISQSGSALALWSKPFNELQLNVTYAQATFVKCEEFIGNNKKLIECLRRVSASDLVDSADNFKLFSVEPVTVYAPVIEKQTERNPRPFLTKQPIDYIQNQEFKNIPWISGVTQDEGILRSAMLVRQSETLKQLNDNFDTYFPQMLLLQASTLKPEELFAQILEFYLNGEHKIDPSNPASIQGLTNIYTDRSMVYPSYQTVMLHSALNHSNMWFYNFDYKGEFSYGDHFAATEENVNFTWGVSHCDDLLYLFRSPALFKDLTRQTDIEMLEFLTELWTRFAISGNPNPINNEFWPNVEIKGTENMFNDNLSFLNITGSVLKENLQCQIDNGLYKERMKFWSSKELFENFPGLN